MKKGTFKKIKEMITSQGFEFTHSVMSDSHNDSGVFFAHADGRKAVIRNQSLQILPAVTEQILTCGSDGQVVD